MTQSFDKLPKTAYCQSMIVNEPIKGKFYLDLKSLNPDDYPLSCSDYPYGKTIELNGQSIVDAVRSAWQEQLKCDRKYLAKFPNEDIKKTPDLTDFIRHKTPPNNVTRLASVVKNKVLDGVRKESKNFKGLGNQVLAVTLDWDTYDNLSYRRKGAWEDHAYQMANEAFPIGDWFDAVTIQGIAKEMVERDKSGKAYFNSRVLPLQSILAPNLEQSVGIFVGATKTPMPVTIPMISGQIDNPSFPNEVSFEVTGNPRVGQRFSVDTTYLDDGEFKRAFDDEMAILCEKYSPNFFEGNRAALTPLGEKLTEFTIYPDQTFAQAHFENTIRPAVQLLAKGYEELQTSITENDDYYGKFVVLEQIFNRDGFKNNASFETVQTAERLLYGYSYQEGDSDIDSIIEAMRVEHEESDRFTPPRIIEDTMLDAIHARLASSIKNENILIQSLDSIAQSIDIAKDNGQIVELNQTSPKQSKQTDMER